MKKIYLISIACIILFPNAAAAYDLSGQHLERLHKAKGLLGDVELRSVDAIAEEFNKTSYPEGNVQIYEAIAQTYTDLVLRKDITEPEVKKDLYSQILLNVAFIQFGGDPDSENGKTLDVWIRQTLLRHLPRNLMENDKLFYSLE